MTETKKNWTVIPGPYPRKMCIAAYNKASGCEYLHYPKSDDDSACEQIIAEVRGVVKAKSLDEAVKFVETETEDNASPYDTWASEWRNPNATPTAMIKRLRTAWRELVS
jgi:hypothetical protein